MNYAKDYIGLEWIPYATGPDAYDCWGLVVHCLKAHYGLSVDRFENVLTDDHKGINRAFLEEAKKPYWKEISIPVEGCIVMMTERKRFFHHIGIFTQDRVLHAKDGSNVALESIGRIKQTGIKQMKFYIHDSIISNN